MADFSWLSALPIGLLLFGATAAGIARRKAARRLTRKGFPALADRLGLSWEPPRHQDAIGRLSGSYRGYGVLVDPDERARVVLDVATSLPIDARTYEHWKRCPPGFELFSFGMRATDDWFVNRYCKDGLVERLRGNSELVGLISRLRNVSDRLIQVSLADRRIECLFNFGAPAYLPPSLVEATVPLLAELAGALLRLEESTAVTDGPPPA